MTTVPPGAPPAPPPTRRGRALASWRSGLAYHHDFRQLWIGDTVSQLGTQLSLLALPVLAIEVLGADAFQMGVLVACETLAFLAIGLPAGAWVDRWRKRRVMITADVARALLLASLPIAWATDVLTLAQMFVVAVAFGVFTVFFDVSYQSYLPDLVPSDRISEGNAKLQASQSVSMVAGPSLGGFLIRAVGAPLTLVVDAISFLVSAAYLGRIRHAETPPAKETRRSLRTEIAEGLSFVLRQPLLVRITATTATSNFFASVANALFVLYALRDLDITPSQIGLIFSAGAVGGLFAALLATRIGRWLGEGRTIPLSSLTAVPFVALTPVASAAPAPWVVPLLAAGTVGMFFCVVVYNVTQVSFRQRLCPKPLLGRMNASVRFIVWGTMPVGAFVGGVLGTWLGIVPALWVGVAGQALASLPVLLSPLLRMRDLPRELDAHAGT